MDGGWRQENQDRHKKRTFTEMSHSATLSPSPALFGESGPSNFFSSRNTLSYTPPHVHERRRTSHPHNNSLQRSSTDMAEPSLSQRPRLEHRQSQTIIDLTDDMDDEPVALPPRASRRPQLGRSDGGNLINLVDLTGDSEERDVVITGTRQLPPPRRRPHVAAPPPRAPSPSLFVPQGPNGPVPSVAPAAGVSAHGPYFQHPTHAAYQSLNSPGTLAMIRGAIRSVGAPAAIHQFVNDHLHLWHDGAVAQAMPGAMNYHQQAFAERKPDFVPPPPAPNGFTRSPTDKDIVICPSCEEEMIHEHEKENVGPVKRGGKAPNRKDMEEHPFWVVKECGHVYCNKCYQFRQQASKQPGVNFVETTRQTNKKTKTLLCNVQACTSDVKSKDKWIGVFL